MFQFLSNLQDYSVPEPIAVYPLNDQYGTKEKDCRQPPGILGNGVSLAQGPFGKGNGSYQFHGTEDSYIEFPNNAGGLDAQHSITMICWVYISESSTSGPLFIYYNKPYAETWFGMAIKNATLAAYFGSDVLSFTQKKKLTSNHWHYVGVTYDHGEEEARLFVNGKIVGSRSFSTGFRRNKAVRMGAVSLMTKRGNRTFKFKGRISAVQVYNVSLTEQQIDDVKNVSGRGKSISCKKNVF